MKRIILLFRFFLIITAAVFFINGCNPEDDIVAPVNVQGTSSYDSEVAVKWFETELELIKKTPGFTPPVAARALGYSGITLYESVVPGMVQYTTLAGQINQMPPLSKALAGAEYHWAASANSALAKIIKNLFASTSQENIAIIENLEAELNAKFRSQVSEDVFNRSVNFGRVIAAEIFEYSKSDGGHEGYLRNFPSDYTPPSGPGMWVPTGSSGALQPYWGNNTPFLLLNSSVDAIPHPDYSVDKNSDFYSEAQEVFSVTSGLSEEQKNIALFWSDDPVTTFTPPGHSISITTQIVKKENLRLDKASVVFAKVGIAVNDAFICCWKTKFIFNLLRPVTYINNEIDQSWKPLLNTPPFPEYTSGHSVQTAATAQILSDTFGYEYPFTDNSHSDRGLAPRKFNSFNEYAEEAAISRLYGGIHYRAAIDNGITQGYLIGKNIRTIQFYK